ncbi:MAG: hypothetical protein B6U97_00950 [Candidatus Altiarchaeales archaeon ex4484_96]|nr:MAG: hypothetical protein B6U97_00950 [Candidatus Altiarchaeales archaeon ex4484_96]
MSIILKRSIQYTIHYAKKPGVYFLGFVYFILTAAYINLVQAIISYYLTSPSTVIRNPCNTSARWGEFIP